MHGMRGAIQGREHARFLDTRLGKGIGLGHHSGLVLVGQVTPRVPLINEPGPQAGHLLHLLLPAQGAEERDGSVAPGKVADVMKGCVEKGKVESSGLALEQPAVQRRRACRQV